MWFLIVSLLHQVKHSSRSGEGVMSTSTSAMSVPAAFATPARDATEAVRAIEFVAVRKFIMGSKLNLMR